MGMLSCLSQSVETGNEQWQLTCYEGVAGYFLETQCVFPENIQTPATEGIGNSGGAGGFNGPGNSKGERGFEATFTSRWSGK